MDQPALGSSSHKETANAESLCSRGASEGPAQSRVSDTGRFQGQLCP